MPPTYWGENGLTYFTSTACRAKSVVPPKLAYLVIHAILPLQLVPPAKSDRF